MVAVIPEGDNLYTLSAIDSNNLESPKSPVYKFTILPIPVAPKILRILDVTE